MKTDWRDGTAMEMEWYFSEDIHILYTYYCIGFHGLDKIKLHGNSSFVMIVIVVIFLSLS